MLTIQEELWEAEAYINRQRKTIEQYEAALKHIANRKMSMYLSKDDMLNDFIKIANEALKED